MPIPPSTTYIVTLFQDIHYGGQQWGFSYSRSYVGDAANDRASSYVIKPGYSAIFYKDANFQNEILRARGDSGSSSSQMPTGLNDVISSVRIFEGNFARELSTILLGVITVFEDINFGGTHWGFGKSESYVGDAVNDRISSFILAPGYSAIFYRDANFQNEVMRAQSGTGSAECYWVGDNCNDIISSFRIYAANPGGSPIELAPNPTHIVTLYRDINFGGTSWGYDSSTAYVGDAANDQASSLVVKPGYSAWLCKDSNYLGNVFSSNIDARPFLDPGWNDAISSLRIFEGAREILTLTKCQVTFFTHSDNKDDDTILNLAYCDDSGTQIASKSNITGEFRNNSTNGPLQLDISHLVPLDSAKAGTFKIGIVPNGHDTWRFSALVELLSDDSGRTIVSTFFDGLVLDQNNRSIDLPTSRSSGSQAYITYLSPAAPNMSVPQQAYFEVLASGVDGIEFSAYYAEDPNDVSTVAWRDIGTAQQTSPGKWSITWDTTPLIDTGNAGWGTVNICAYATGNYPGRLSPRVYCRVSIDNPLPLANAHVSITQPDANANVFGVCQVYADASGVHTVFFDVQGGPAIGRGIVPTNAPGTWYANWDTRQLPDGAVTLRAYAPGRFSGSGPRPQAVCRVNVRNHTPPPMVSVPSVVGLTEDQALIKLANANLTVNQPQPAGGLLPRAYTVTSQNPGAGASVQEGSNVVLGLQLASSSVPACQTVRCHNASTSGDSLDVWMNSNGSWEKQESVPYGSTASITIAENSLVQLGAWASGTTPNDTVIARDQVSVIGGSSGTYDWNLF